MFIPHAIEGTVGTISLTGQLTSEQIRGFGAAVRALSDHPDVETIEIRINSPGGVYSDVQNAAQACAAVPPTKSLMFRVGEWCLNSAYWLASQGKIAVEPESAVGFEFAADVDANDRTNMQQDIRRTRPTAQAGYQIGQSAIDSGLADFLVE